MSNIKKAFEHGKAFIPFITCGDPDLETTAEIIRAAAANGADLIELGIPFSDPTAEGPVIQEAYIRALSGGVTTDKIFDMVQELRKDLTIPMVFMTYANVVYSYRWDGVSGLAVPADHKERKAEGSVQEQRRTDDVQPEENGSSQKPSGGAAGFIRRCADVGIDGLILPDLPYEEKEEFLPLCRRYGIDLISLIAPTSKDRVAAIAKDAEGFIYIVSSLGVTGVRNEIRTDLTSIVKIIRGETDVPCAVGFGISRPEQAAAMAAVSDGAIVGSAIIRIIAEHGKDSAPYVGEYIRSMKEALKR